MGGYILTAAIDGFFSSPAGGCVTSAPINMTGSENIGGLMFGTMMLLIPPNLTLILRHKLDKV
jgi:hypothetical protein